MLSKRRIFIFFACLIALEALQYLWSNNLEFRFGDFAKPGQISANALVLATLNWLLAMCVCLLTVSEKNGNAIRLPVNLVTTLFVGNFLLTFFGSVGHIGAAKSSFGFLTTLFPINYMIFVIAADKHYERIRPFAFAMLILIDLSRLLFGAFLKIAVIIYSKIGINKRSMILMVFIFALTPIVIEQKYRLRDLPIDTEVVLVQGFVSRIAMTNTFDYVLEDIEDLSVKCNTHLYSAALPLYGLSLIPKSIFGLSYSKSLNNCLIETYTGSEVRDSSVNTPLIASILLKSYGGISFNSFEFITINLMMLVVFVTLCNFVFGASGGILKLWVIFEFFWTGNILTLSIPIYFCTLMLGIAVITKGVKR